MSPLRNLRIVAAVSSALVFSGCYHTMVRSGVMGVNMRESSRTGWNIAWGIVRADIDAPECSAGLAQVETWTPWWGYFIEVLTVGILTPERADYVCALPPQMQPMPAQPYSMPQQPPGNYPPAQLAPAAPPAQVPQPTNPAFGPSSAAPNPAFAPQPAAPR